MSVFEDSYLKIEPDPNEIQNFTTLYTVTSKVEDGQIAYSVNHNAFTRPSNNTEKILLTDSCSLSILLFGYDPYSFNVTISKQEDGTINILDNGIQLQKEKTELLSREQFVYTSIEKIDDNKYLRY